MKTFKKIAVTALLSQYLYTTVLIAAPPAKTPNTVTKEQAKPSPVKPAAKPKLAPINSVSGPQAGEARENEWSIAAGFETVGLGAANELSQQGPNFTLTSKSLVRLRDPRVGLYIHGAKLQMNTAKEASETEETDSSAKQESRILTAGLSVHGPFMEFEKWKTHLDIGVGTNLDDESKPIYADLEFGYIYALPYNFHVALNIRKYFLLEGGTGANIMLSQRF